MRIDTRTTEALKTDDDELRKLRAPIPTAAGQQRAESNLYFGAGVGMGAIGVAGLLLGATCPACFVATPALVGAGVYKRIRARRAASDDAERVDTATAKLARE